MENEDEPKQRPTIAGRALRAMRTTRPLEPADSTEVVEVPDASEPAPSEATPSEPTPAEPEPEAELPPEGETVLEPAPRQGNGLLIAAVVLVAAALAFFAVGVIVYVRGTDSSASKIAHARDDALAAARIDIATLRTLSYRDPKSGLQKWVNVTTGKFSAQIAADASKQAAVITQAKRVTVGKVDAAALTDLDVAKGTAVVIATVDTTITPAGGTSSLERERYQANLQKDHGAWKVADLEFVPVALS